MIQYVAKRYSLQSQLNSFPSRCISINGPEASRTLGLGFHFLAKIPTDIFFSHMNLGMMERHEGLKLKLQVSSFDFQHLPKVIKSVAHSIVKKD